MTPQSRTLPRIARATSPSYPDRIAVLFFGGHTYATKVFDSPQARDAMIEKLIAEGVAKKVHIDCTTPGCTCTFPTLSMRESRDGTLLAAAARTARRRRGADARRSGIRGAPRPRI